MNAKAKSVAEGSSSESPNLDIVRATAVLCVFCGHTARTAIFREENDWVWRFAQMGVLIFFVHTSLVLMRSLDRTDGRLLSVFPVFYVRRAFRIYPLAIVCVLAAYFCSYSPSEDDGHFRHWELDELIANLTLTQNLTFADNMWGGLWSLPLEVQMYVILPVLFVAFRHRSAWWLLGLWAASIPLAIAQEQASARLNILGYLPCFLGGVIAWRLEKQERRQLPAWRFPLALVAISAIWLTATQETQLWHRWAFCLAMGLALPYFADLKSGVARAAKTVAKYSYGIYMSHMVALAIAFELIPGVNFLTRWAIFLLLALVLPVAMYHAIEEPGIRIGQRIAKRIQVGWSPQTQATAPSASPVS